MNIGIDAGGTLIKIAYCQDGMPPEFEKFPAARLEDAVAWINALGTARICLTGGKATMMRPLLASGASASGIVEFEATCRGVQYFLNKIGVTEPSYLLTNVGTGTSIHYVAGDKHERVGGTGIGGGTLLGLSRLLTGVTEYDDIVRLASEGARDRIDLKVSHIYEGAEPPIPGDLTASNFGHVLKQSVDGSYSKEELIASVVGLVGETAATVSVLAAGKFGVSTVVFIGSSFIRNRPLKESVQTYTKLRGALPLFIEQGEYSGAVGALLYES